MQSVQRAMRRPGGRDPFLDYRNVGALSAKATRHRIREQVSSILGTPLHEEARALQRARRLRRRERPDPFLSHIIPLHECRGESHEARRATLYACVLTGILTALEESKCGHSIGCKTVTKSQFICPTLLSIIFCNLELSRQHPCTFECLCLVGLRPAVFRYHHFDAASSFKLRKTPSVSWDKRLLTSWGVLLSAP